jgi:hypothetical protein
MAELGPRSAQLSDHLKPFERKIGENKKPKLIGFVESFVQVFLGI